MAKFAEYQAYDAMGLADLVRRREIASAELVDTALEAIENLNPRRNAVVRTLAAAREAAQGALPEGPFRDRSVGSDENRVVVRPSSRLLSHLTRLTCWAGPFFLIRVCLSQTSSGVPR